MGYQAMLVVSIVIILMMVKDVHKSMEEADDKE